MCIRDRGVSARVRQGHERACRAACELGFLSHVRGNRLGTSVPPHPSAHAGVPVLGVVFDGQRRADRSRGSETVGAKRLLEDGALIAGHGLDERGVWSSIEDGLDKDLPGLSGLDGARPCLAAVEQTRIHDRSVDGRHPVRFQERVPAVRP